MQRTVALKVLKASLLTHGDALARFRREAKVISSLNHPSIVSVYSIGASSAGVPYLAMEFLQGQTLAQLIAQQGKLPYQEALPIFMQVCDALTHAHEKGIIHRDLKPGNLVIERENDQPKVKIVDFGISKILSSDQGLTKTSAIVGSVLYMSPEQSTGGVPTAASDIYSLGCTLYETLVGRPPLFGDSIAQTVLMHQQETAPAATSLVADLPDSLDRLLACCLEKEAGNRYPTAAALKSDLDNVLHGRPLQHLPQRQQNATSAGRAAGKKLGSSSVRSGSGALVVLCVVAVAGGGALFYILQQRSEHAWRTSEVDDGERRANADRLLARAYDLIDNKRLQEAEAALQEVDDYAAPLQNPYYDGYRFWSRARIESKQAQQLPAGTTRRRELLRRAEVNYAAAYKAIRKARKAAQATENRRQLEQLNIIEMLYLRDSYELLVVTQNPRPMPLLAQELTYFLEDRGRKLSGEEQSFFNGVFKQAFEQCAKEKRKDVVALVVARVKICQQQGYARQQIEREIETCAEKVQSYNPEGAETIRNLRPH